LLLTLFEGLEAEGLAMPYTMEDFNRQFFRERFLRLTPEQRREMLQALPPEERRDLLRALPPEQVLAALSPEQIRQYLDRLAGERPASARKPRRKK
jgi:Mg/Co/Ni transporter MgtE